MLKRIIYLAVFLFSTPVFACPPNVEPMAPTEVEAYATSSTSAMVKWSDDSPCETGYRVESSLDGVNYIPVGEVGANRKYLHVQGLIQGGYYNFRVAALNSVGAAVSWARPWVATSQYLVSFKQLGAPGTQVTPERLACGADGTCFMIASINGEGTLCGRLLSNTQFVAKLAPDRTCLWAQPTDQTPQNLSDDLLSDIAVASNGVVAVTGRQDGYENSFSYSRVLVRRLDPATGAVLWEKTKSTFDGDGFEEEWFANSVAFDPSGANIYIAGSHSTTNAQGNMFYYAMIERFTTAAGVNTQIVNITGQSTLGPAVATREAAFSDVIVRSDNTVVATGYRSFENANNLRYDLLVRIGNTTHTIVGASGVDTDIEGEILAEDKSDRSIYVMADAWSEDSSLQIYKFNAAGSLMQGYPKSDNDSYIWSFYRGDAGVDSARRLWISTYEDLATFDSNVSFLYSQANLVFYPGGAGAAMVGDTVVVLHSYTRTPWEDYFYCDWIERGLIGNKDLVLAGYSSTVPRNPIDIVPPTGIGASLKVIRRQTETILRLTFDTPAEMAGRENKFRLSLFDYWYFTRPMSSTYDLSFPTWAPIPEKILIQFRDGEFNWSETQELSLTPFLRGEDTGVLKDLSSSGAVAVD